ncbi:unnamed protein product (macronuclear) [Paramecium tetraurelia]|uniref:Myb-like domain-containing protein n=1 Tax=Paramecium tetraurelia TaxID=5888 RepID=A0E048_PARTE|nr:uncharacterized protein GSPATT00021833001 [Paramecium tetraurelia]CAK88665.1 unnamed protein product [Paramecium tetraurelia]|eukprot:XP_001456062.1 hypothetical protein (macronuclear) [Paramecium tetraurelia strain d4-2]
MNIYTNCKQNVPEIQTIDQNNHQTLVELGFQEKSPSIEQDLQGRGYGHWTTQEHLQYLDFIKSHENTLISKYEKKSKKIFKLMSEFIPTRTPTQCRSHHQKFNPLIKGKKNFKSPFGYTTYN